MWLGEAVDGEFAQDAQREQRFLDKADASVDWLVLADALEVERGKAVPKVKHKRVNVRGELLRI